jgi:hypothetical protein
MGTNDTILIRHTQNIICKTTFTSMTTANKTQTNPVLKQEIPPKIKYYRNNSAKYFIYLRA